MFPALSCPVAILRRNFYVLVFSPGLLYLVGSCSSEFDWADSGLSGMVFRYLSSSSLKDSMCVFCLGQLCHQVPVVLLVLS